MVDIVYGEHVKLEHFIDVLFLIIAMMATRAIISIVLAIAASANFSEHDAYVNSVTLSPDGQLAYSAADDGKVIACPIAAVPVDEILAHIADNRVLRDFTCVERKQYRIRPLCDANGVVPDEGN